MKLKLFTITPVHIGAGEDKIYSSYADYVMDQDKLYIVDNFKLSQYISQEFPEKYEEYILLLKNQHVNQKNKYNLKSFFLNNKIDYKNFILYETFNSNAITEEIERTLTQSNYPYIPGSTIKGSIRTSILYDEVKNNKENRIDTRVEGKIFGEYANDTFKYLQISDSNLGNKEDLGVEKLYRYHILKKEKQMPIVKEVIKDNIEFEFSLKTIGRKDQKIKNYFKKNNEKSIFSKINMMSKDIIKKELDMLSACREAHEIKEIYKHIEKEIDSLIQNNNGAILRIGSDKTFYSNTLGLLYNDRQLKKYADAKSPFPKTRSFCYNNSTASNILGWVKIYPSDKENVFKINIERNTRSNDEEKSLDKKATDEDLSKLIKKFK